MSDSRQPDVLEVIEFAPDEIIRVLEVRPRTRLPPSAPAPVLSVPPARPFIVPPASAKAMPAPAVPLSTKRERSLEETLDDLQTLAVSISGEDETSSTGVRHLRVELERPARSLKKR